MAVRDRDWIWRFQIVVAHGGWGWRLKIADGDAVTQDGCRWRLEDAGADCGVEMVLRHGGRPLGWLAK